MIRHHIVRHQHILNVNLMVLFSIWRGVKGKNLLTRSCLGYFWPLKVGSAFDQIRRDQGDLHDGCPNLKFSIHWFSKNILRFRVKKTWLRSVNSLYTSGQRYARIGSGHSPSPYVTLSRWFFFQQHLSSLWMFILKEEYWYDWNCEV